MKTEKEIKAEITELKERFDLCDPRHSDREKILARLDALYWVIGGKLVIPGKVGWIG